jgi:hypothetical protein
VDDPQGSATRADQLVSEVMEARGYPVGISRKWQTSFLSTTPAW